MCFLTPAGGHSGCKCDRRLLMMRNVTKFVNKVCAYFIPRVCWLMPAINVWHQLLVQAACGTCKHRVLELAASFITQYSI